MISEYNAPVRIRYFLESLLVTLSYWILAILPISIASATGGFIASQVGPFLKRTTIARNNIKKAMPELKENEVEGIIRHMWANIGRTLSEFPHVGKLDDEIFREIVEFEGLEHIIAADQFNKGSIYFTGHLANWEMAAKAFAVNGYPLTVVIRKANNPGLAKIIKKSRASYQAGSISKGRSGAREMMRALQAGERIGIFVDQKMNNGIKTSFFGREAMTAPAIASLALKYDYPILPVKIVRTAALRYKVTVFPPIKVTKSNDNNSDILDIMNNINAILENWIRENPEQWYWIHNRWI